MKLRILTYTLFLLVKINPVIGQENINISGYMRNYTGVLTGGRQDFSIIQNTFNLNFMQRSDRVGFIVNPYLYHYFDSNLELGIREAYLDLYFKGMDIRVGKQQIIYGKAEGVFITDVVSPKDLREFLLPDFDEIRIGITSVKMNLHFGNNNLESVWVPVFTPTRMPEGGSIWQPDMPFPVTPSYDDTKSGIDPGIKNSELFLRFSSMSSRADIEIVGGYFWSDDPAMHVTKEVDPVTMQLSGIHVRPEHHRLAMGGMSMSLPVGSLVLRGEAGYYGGKYFQTETFSTPDAIIRRDYLHYMSGVDFTLAGIRLSTQFIQEYIPNYESGIQNDKFENTMTFLAKKDFFREKLWIELFTYIGLNNEDALIRPKVSFSFADGFDIQSGANVFLGKKGRFGQYNDNDMLYMKLRYSF